MTESDEGRSAEDAAAAAIRAAAEAAESAPPSEASIAEASIPEASTPEVDVSMPAIPEPHIPEPDIPPSAFDDPVIPPAPADMDPSVRGDRADDGGDDSKPRTRANRRGSGAAKLTPPEQLPERPPMPRDPAVVPPASGATTGDYRGWTIAILTILLVLLVGAVITVIVLATSGPNLFAAAFAGAMPLAILLPPIRPLAAP